MESVITYLYHNVESIIYISITLLIILCLLLLVVAFFSNKNKSSETKTDQLEATLKKVLESAELKSSPMPIVTGEGSPEIDAMAAEEVGKLKVELEAKASEITNLKKQIEEKTADGANPEEIGGLQNKVRELEAKLAEYEIIEDDIANLSMYRDENQRLKEELQKLKAAESTSETTLQQDAEAVAAEEEPKQETQEEIVAEPAAQDEEDAVVAEAAPQEEAEQEVASEAAPEEDFQKVAEESVEDCKEDDSGDDIMAEFVAAVDEPPASSKSAPQEETPKEETPKAEASAGVLDSEPNPDQIISEMGDLLKAESEAPPEDDGDPSDKLIKEFEDLTKA